MEPEAPSGPDRKRSNHRWRWFLATLLLSGPILFGASNLALDSRWSREWVASQIKSRTTLDASVGGITWSPWNGITMRDLRIEQPGPLKPLVSSPLIRASGINVLPNWKALLGKRLDVRSITLISPEVVLPIELISHFAPPAPIPPVASTPSVASNDPSPAIPTLGSPTAPTTPPVIAGNTPPAPVVKTPAETAPSVAPPAPETLPPPASGPAISTDPSAFVHLENASLSLVLASASTSVFEVSGVEGSIPIQGPPAKSELAVKTVRSMKTEIARGLRLPVEWHTPFLTMPPLEIPVAGLKTRTGGQMAMTSGLPVAFECQAPDQPLAPIHLPGGAVFRPADVSSILRFRGMLAAPSTWQVDFISAASKPVVTSDGHETRFDHAQAVTVLRGGTLSCVDARMTGDDVSFLGNATLLSNGKAAAVLRIVAPPETSLSIIRKLFPGITAPPAFNSMSTPQRAALDIEVSGSLGDLDIRLGKNGPLVGRPTPPDSAQPE